MPRKQQPPAAPTLKRRLTFYKWRCPDDPPIFDRLRAARALGQLPETNERKYRRGDYSADALLVAEGDPTEPTAVLVMRLRDYANRPYVRRPGDAPAPVNMDPDADLLDIAQGLIWGDGVAAFVQGGHTPPPAYFTDFLVSRTGHHIVFDPLFDRGLVERLKGMEGIRGLELRMRNSPAMQSVSDAQLGPIAGLFQRFRGQQQEVVLSQQIAVPGRGKGARKAVLPAISVDDVVNMTVDADQLYDVFVVKGKDLNGRSVTIDLLSQRLYVERDLPRARAGGHHVENDAAFDALKAARVELDAEQRIEHAVAGHAPASAAPAPQA